MPVSGWFADRRVSRPRHGWLPACATPPAESADVVRTDSAGVRIVSSGAVDRELPWRFDSVDVLHDTLGEPWLTPARAAPAVLIDRLDAPTVLTQNEGIVRFDSTGDSIARSVDPELGPVSSSSRSRSRRRATRSW